MTSDRIASAYDQWAVTYDGDQNKTRDLDAEVLRALPTEYLRGDVLELGCGTGKNTTWLSKCARSVMALDYSEGMLAIASRSISSDHVRFAQHDIREPLPSESQSFDFVTIDLVLEHVEDMNPVFAEAARVLRPGGRLHVCELHPYRQLEGVKARFISHESQTVVIDAYLHNVADFLNAALAVGLVLEAVRELPAPGDAPQRGPRLLSLVWLRHRNHQPCRSYSHPRLMAARPV